MIRIEKVNGKNVWDLLKLKVSDEQRNFVASNDISIIEAYTAITGNGYSFPFGIYKEDKPVGFLMIGFDVDDYWEDAPAVAKGNYNLWRRMTLAAQELSREDVKVIDVAIKYGYESSDSFAKAFQKFHGITPSQAREAGAPLRSFAPLHIKITMEGGTMLDYRIVEKAPFTIVGTKRRFNSDTSYQEIPKFWAEYMGQGEKCPIMGTFGVCVDMGDKDFDYWIADLYKPWEAIPEDCDTYQIPGSLWAQFLCKGALPDSLQSVNTKIWSEWLPALQGYELAGKYNLEVYGPPTENPEDYVSYIWIPLKKV